MGDGTKDSHGICRRGLPRNVTSWRGGTRAAGFTPTISHPILIMDTIQNSGLDPFTIAFPFYFTGGMCRFRKDLFLSCWNWQLHGLTVLMKRGFESCCRCPAILVCLLFFFPASRLHAIEFEIEGESKVEISEGVYSGATNVTRTKAGKFRVSVRSCTEWLVQLTQERSQIDSIELGASEGGLIYQVLDLSARAKREEKRSGKRPINSGIAQVQPGPVPCTP